MLLLGRLGRHGVALAIYAHVLQDPQMAEDYCRKIYDPEREETKKASYLKNICLSQFSVNVPDSRSVSVQISECFVLLL